MLITARFFFLLQLAQLQLAKTSLSVFSLWIEAFFQSSSLYIMTSGWTANLPVGLKIMKATPSQAVLLGRWDLSIALVNQQSK